MMKIALQSGREKLSNLELNVIQSHFCIFSILLQQPNTTAYFLAEQISLSFRFIYQPPNAFSLTDNMIIVRWKCHRKCDVRR